MSKIFEWLHHNGFKANPGKFLFLINPFVDRPIKILGSTIKASTEEVLLRVRIDSDLTFKEHVTSICAKANQKLHALTRVSKYMSLQKRRILMKSFITSLFNYCPIVWMYHNKSLKRKVNHIHERALRIVYQDFQSRFSAFLVKDNCLSRSNIHSTHFGIESIANIAARIGNKRPNEIKEARSLIVFKSKSKNGFQRIALADFPKHVWGKWVLYN